MPPIPLAAAAAGGLDVWAMVLQAGAMSKLVLLCLAGFSVVSWGIMAERFRRFVRAERESQLFLARFRESPGLATLDDHAAQLVWSPVAQVFRSGFRELRVGQPAAAPSGEAWTDDPEGVDRMLRKSALVHQTELERSLGFLATTASATPFIGLFGTVWGIMNAFRAIGTTGTASLAAYAPGIAEALIATAAGLAAAIPAVIGYNHFLGRLRGMDALVEEFIADFLHRIHGRRG